MYKIAAVGDRESVLTYKAFGITTVPAENAAQATNALHRLAADGDYAIILLTEQLAEQIPEVLERYAEHTTPAIIMIPGSKGSLHIGLDTISTAVERAVGADIFAGQD